MQDATLLTTVQAANIVAHRTVFWIAVVIPSIGGSPQARRHTNLLSAVGNETPGHQATAYRRSYHSFHFCSTKVLPQRDTSAGSTWTAPVVGVRARHRFKIWVVPTKNQFGALKDPTHKTQVLSFFLPLAEIRFDGYSADSPQRTLMWTTTIDTPFPIIEDRWASFLPTSPNELVGV